MIKEIITKVVGGENLTSNEAEIVMQEVMRGEATPSQISAFIVALRMKGETAEEIAGCARAMRDHSTKVETKHKQVIDTCGTGGDSTGTFNISTAVAFVIAGAGIAVAKHGNRSVSSQCGSADVLEALGVKIDLKPDEIARCLDEIGIGFLFAPGLHPAMKYAIGPRREVGIRTIFNVLGPLTNPASASIQLLGVYDSGLTETIARVLGLLGSYRALVVHGADGLDELSTTGINKITQLYNGEINTYNLDPGRLGLPLASPIDLKGGSPEENAEILKALLKGEKGAKRDIVLLNAAAGLLVAEKVADFEQGISLAVEAIDSGRAMDRLEKLVELSQSFAVE